MRLLVPLLALSLAVAAQPPAVKDFRRLKKLRDEIASQIAQLTEAEEYARKPREEKMLIAFERLEKRFENKPLTGELVVETCLLKWDAVLQDPPTEAGKRVLAKLPEVFYKRYGAVIDIPKDRKEMAKSLCDALDSDFLQVRSCAFETLKKVYHTPSGFMYVETMPKKDRQEPIRNWRKFINRQK